MDDLNLLSSSVSGAKTLLHQCAKALKWAGLDFWSDKSRNIVIIKGKFMNTTPFSVSEPKNSTDFSSYIPSIHSRPIKFLGQIIDSSISDRNSLDELEKKLVTSLGIIDKSFFNGTQKLWILQHLLIPRIQWPLLVYEVPISHATKLEQKISSFIRKWLHLHKSTSSLCFYSKASPSPLPTNNLTSALKSAKISGHLQLHDSQDPLVANYIPQLKTGSWHVEEAVTTTEIDVKNKLISGHHQFGHNGLGYSPGPKTPPNKSTKLYCKFISSYYKNIDDTYSVSKAVQLQVQGQWNHWINYIQNGISWESLLELPVNQVSFCLVSTFDVLPSPSNIPRWKISTDAACTLCKKGICTTPHILGACKVELKQGRYSFRHDVVLWEIISSLNTFTGSVELVVRKEQNIITFVKKCTKVKQKRLLMWVCYARVLIGFLKLT